MSSTTPLSGISYPSNTDTPDGAAQLQSIATTLDSIIVPRFATTAARNAAITSPQKGQISYLNDLNRYEVYHTSWRPWRPNRTAVMTSNGTRTSTTTNTTEAALNVAVEANKVYIIDYVLFFTGNAGVDAKWTFSGPAGVLALAMHSAASLPATDQTNNLQTYNVNVQPFAGVSGFLGITNDGNAFTKIRLIVTTSASAGTVSFQWSQNVASVLTTTLLAGSYCVYKEVA